MESLESLIPKSSKEEYKCTRIEHITLMGASAGKEMFSLAIKDIGSTSHKDIIITLLAD